MKAAFLITIWIVVVSVFVFSISVFVNWQKYRTREKIYIGFLALIPVVVLSYIIYTNITDPIYYQRKETSLLQEELLKEYRFEGIKAQHHVGKGTRLIISGYLYSEEDLEELKGKISERNWHNLDFVSWNVRVGKTKSDYHGEDFKLGAIHE